jgi:hypothetical protein
MRESVIAIVFLFLYTTGKAQSRQFLKEWFLDLPVPNKPSVLHTYAAKKPNFQLIWQRGDSSSRFLVNPDNKFGNDLIPPCDIDSVTIEIEASFRPEGASENEQRYSGRTVVVTVEYFLKSEKLIHSVMDLLIRKLLRVKFQSADVGPHNSSELYRFGDFLYVDNKNRYRMLEVYENVYAKGTTSLLISFEFEK